MIFAAVYSFKTKHEKALEFAIWAAKELSVLCIAVQHALALINEDKSGF
jgi:hypothetical protein